LELIPVPADQYLGGVRRICCHKFLLYTAVSGNFLLVAFLGVVDFSGASDFAYNPLLSATLPLETQILLLLPILLGSVKTPLVPFHTWLPDAHVEASTPVSVLLGGCYSS